MKGRLNSFQECMRQWNALHPYSAIHVLRLPGLLDVPRLRASINAVVGGHGLARLTLDGDRRAFQYEPGPAQCEIQAVPAGADPLAALVAELERQLNLPFPIAAPFCPFRFVAVDAGDSHFLGLIYFHPAADAESVVCLLQDIVRTYAGREAGDGTNPLELYPDPRARLLRRHPMVVARRLWGLPAQMRNLRQSHRVRHGEAADMTNGFTLFTLDPAALRGLVTAARSWEVTVNDLLLALLMKSLSPCAPARVRASRRRKLSVGCIVNLRRDLGVDSRRTFGVFLGSFSVTHAVPDGIALRDLAGDLSRQTAGIKRHRLYLGTPMELAVARLALRFFSPERRGKFYAKHYPLWGGITNMNLNTLWTRDGDSLPLDYFRGVSTGPITPLVLSVTTLGERANLGVSYRRAVFSPADIEALQGRFRAHLEETGGAS